MKALFLILLIALFLGPLRRPYFRNARFTVPATLGAFVGLTIGAFAIGRSGLTGSVAALVPLVIAVGLAVCLGEVSKEWFDRTFGKRE